MDIEEERTEASALSVDIVHDSPIDTKKWRSRDDLNLREKVLLATTIVSALIVIGITFGRMIYVGVFDPEWTVGAAILLGQAFSIFYVIEGVFTTRATELGALAVTCLFTFVFLIGDYATGPKNAVEVVRLVAASLFGCVVVFLCVVCGWVYEREKRLVRMVAGDSETWQAMYGRLLLFLDLLKLDLQNGISLVLLTTTLHFYAGDSVLLALLSLTFISAFLIGSYAVLKESKKLTILFFGLNLAHLAFAIYSFIVTDDYLDPHPGLGWSTLACGLAFLITRGCVFLGGLMVVRNYGSGLKTRL